MKEGSKFPVKLKFEKAGEVTIQITAEKPGRMTTVRANTSTEMRYVPMRRTGVERALIALLLAAVALLAGCGDGKPALKFNATDITGASFGRQLALTDAATKDTANTGELSGQGCSVLLWVHVLPGLLPNDDDDLNAALGKMKPEDAARVQVVFVTVDPDAIPRNC